MKTATHSKVLATEIRAAGERDIAEVMALLYVCRRHLESRGIYQWNDAYPNEEVVREDVAGNRLFVAMLGSDCVGAVTVDGRQPPEYRTLAWRCGHDDAAVVHRLAVRPAWQKRGVGRLLMDFAEDIAIEGGVGSIRLDAYSGNPRALAFYERRGYRKVGEIFFPKRELPFHCFEKIL